jgi:ActR/RegA family two-component response regulator
MSGFEVLVLRVAKAQTPILILSGIAGIAHKVKGLGLGADDYMTKPFHKQEPSRLDTIPSAPSRQAWAARLNWIAHAMTFGEPLARGFGRSRKAPACRHP